jgi:amino acid adenylation domain-containing protein
MLIKAFRDRVRENPAKIAVKSGDIALTYQFLDECGDRLVRAICQYSPVKGKAASLLLGHNPRMLIAITGALKTGMVYIPFDPGYPRERLNYMLADSGARMIITGDEHVQMAQTLKENTPGPVVIVNLDRIIEDKSAVGDLPGLQEERDSDEPAYILYTSGSTGRPRGVVQTYGNIRYYVRGWSRRFSISSCDRMAQFASFSHDGAVPDIYGSLLNGATLYLFDVKQGANIQSPAQWLNREKISIWHSVPTWYRYVANHLTGAEEFPYLRLVILGGEAVREHDIALFNRHFPRALFANIYGQTESTVNSIWLLRAREEFKNVLIGLPIEETRIFVIDSQGGEVREFETGEIVIASPRLSPGYLNNPEAAHHAFAPDEEFGCLYWSGDLGRMLPGGHIEILGRKDHQVKVRGFRIEPGEIESLLVRHPDIGEAVVTSKESSGGDYGVVSGDRDLWAYFTAKKPLTPGELRRHLAGQLPDYMIPGFFVKLDTMPLTPSGKIDRKALDAHGTRLGTGTPYAPPGNETEKILTRIWKDVLKAEKVGIDDNFFDLGGNSMDVIDLNDRLQKNFKRAIPPVAIFQHLTIRSFAQFLNRTGPPAITTPVGTAGTVKPGPAETGLGIAVTGMAGRFPGARDIDEFWENLKNGVESISFFSDEELEQAGVAPELLQNKHYVRAHADLEDTAYFDAAFFGYNPTEARLMDPQMRIFHECAFHALEDSGVDPYACDAPIALFAGAAVNYAWLAGAVLAAQGDAAGLFSARQLFDKEYLCTRVAYKLNLKGTAISLQTACSTSLVAIHMACRALLDKQCDMALAGGVSVPVTAREGYMYREGMIFSSDGHCRTFDAGADGTVFGKGVGIVVLKRLQDARRDRDHIYAVVKGSFSNNDGLDRGGFTAPSAPGEANVIRAALDTAGVEPESIGCVETHGTGTTLGDPIEIEGLKLAFNTNKKNYCAVGSVKTNVGHLNMAAGVTGFIKTVLALKHALIPPSLNFERPNPAIDFENSPFYVNTKLRPWRNNPHPRRAGVSSFGIGGTNVHVVLEQAPSPVADENGQDREYQLILLSARIPSALERMTQNLAAHLTRRQDISLGHTAYTLMTGRKAFEHRRMLVCSNSAEAVEKLTAPEPGKTHTAFVNTPTRPVIFMFTGLGSQYVNMGRGLYRSEPLFRGEMDNCFDLLSSLTGNHFKEILYPGDQILYSGSEEFNLSRPEFSQPALFIFQYALAKLLMSWGVAPHAMIGYSFGEYAAACISGVLSLEDALKMIVFRGRLVESLTPGAMISVPLPARELQPLLDTHRFLSLAIDNGPSCIAAGPAAAVDDFEKELKQRRLMCMRIPTARALHSDMMEPILSQFRDHIARDIALNKPRIPYISNVTGNWAVPEDVVQPSYWSRHLSSTVRFADGVRELMKIEDALFLEIGPGRELSALMVRHIEGKPGFKTSSLVRHRDLDTPDLYFLLNRLGRLWLWGVSPDWDEFFEHRPRRRVPLPKYPFEPSPYPVEVNLSLTAGDAGGLPAPGTGEAPPPNVIVQGAVENQTTGRPPGLEIPYMPPGNDIQHKIARAWVEFFGFKSIGIRDDFFELGGDSLKALVMITKINEAIEIELTMDEFFRNPTIERLAAVVQERQENPLADMLKAAGADGEKEIDLTQYVRQPFVLLNRPDQRAIFCFPPVFGFGVAYKSLSIQLHDCSLYAFNFLEDPDRLNTYIELITDIQPVGPYVLLGFSAAGKLTYEVARAMEKHGCTVSDVILLDYFHSAPRVEGNLDEAMQYLGAYLDDAGTGVLKEAVALKIKKYREYYAAPTTVEKVNANLHLILSEENKNISHAGCWDGFSTNSCTTYRGFGEHTGMINPGAVEKNAVIIRNILRDSAHIH